MKRILKVYKKTVSIVDETPIDMYDPNREQPILVQAGDYIRFVPITIMDYYDIRRAVLDGKYQIEVTEE